MRLNVMQVRRAALACGVLTAALLGASCGGGQQVTTFSPTRLIAFGDETSVILDINGDGNGAKYSVNATASDTDPTLVCQGNPLWIQRLAAGFSGLVFAECNPGPTPVTTPSSRIRATVGAHAADLAAQIDAQLAESAFSAGDLVTVLVGVNDVLDQYAQYPTQSEPQITANVEAAGAEVGRQVNRLADAGAKVIVSTIPDVGYSPFAIAEKAAHIDTDRQTMIIRIVLRFNASLRSTIVNDGRRIGLVTADELVESIVAFPGLDGITNTTTAACDLGQSKLTPASILDCTSQTLISGSGAASNLWADDRHLSSGAQSALGDSALTRAKNNPF